MTERYNRQTLLPQIGSQGQEKLNKASVLVIGVGGLGSPALTYLAAAGVGHLGVVDSDTVTLSNLNRQFLHNISDIGKLKVESAKEKLFNLNNEIEIKIYNERLTGENAKSIFSGYNIILGAVDSYEIRFVINKACVSLGIPYIDGGVNGFSGCVLFSNPPQTPCLNCIFPETGEKKEPSGILGTTAGIIGTIEANVAILHLLDLPNPIGNKLLLYDGLFMNFEYRDIKRRDNCHVCSYGKNLKPDEKFEPLPLLDGG